ncbi:MAG: S9 family peptidase, partial [Planctomycetota bacterium]
MYLTTVNMPAIRGSLAALTLLIAVGVGCQSQSTIGAAPEDAPKTDEEGVNTPGSSKTIPSTKEVALIPRSVLFGNPQRASARISPNGEWLSFLAPVDGILNVWVAPVDDLEAAKPITDDKVRDIRSHSWAYTGDRILYTQDKEGDENWHVYATNVETGETTDLTPIDGVNARIQGLSDRIPDAILVGLNDRDPRLHDVYRVDLETGERELVQQNPGVAGFVIDDDFDVRFAVNFTMDGGQVLLKSTAGEGGAKEWTEEFIKIGPEDAMTTGPAGFNKDGTVLYMLDSRDRNTGALFALDLETGEKKLVAKNDKADVGEVLAHPTKKTIEAVGFTYSRREWDILEDSIRADLDYLASVEDGELIVTSRTLDDSLWTVAYLLDDGPLKFYLYDRDNRNAKYLFSSRDDLDEY